MRKNHLRAAAPPTALAALAAAIAALAGTPALLGQENFNSATGLRLNLTPDGGVQLDWNGGGTLEASADMKAWIPQSALPATEKNSMTLPLTAKQLFFRVRGRDGSISEVLPLIPNLPENAPQFDDVTVQGFDGQSIETDARLKPGTAAPPQIPYLIGDRIIILHDDGQNGDAVAGDRSYHGEFPLTVPEVNRSLAFLNSLNQQQKTQPKFLGASRRIDEASPWNLDDSKTKLQNMLLGQPVQLPIFMGVSRSAGSPAAGGRAARGGGGGAAGVTPCGLLPTWQKTLLITDLSVVEDWNTSPPGTRTYDPCTGQGTPGGAWTFGKLMADMANTPLTGVTASDFARRWLKTWSVPQMINNDPVPARPSIMSTILSTWETVSGGPNMPLDMNEAPFRLLAIVNRVDLRGNVTYGGGGKDPCNPDCESGEARFVFCYCGHKAVPSSCNPPPREFLVIFEYCIPKRGCVELCNFAQEWADLECIPFGDAYNQALQKITDQFATAGAFPGRPNGSALNQLRTNEVLLNPVWELREFRIFSNDSDAHFLRPVTVKQTPREDVDATARLAHYITTTAPPPPNHSVPLEWAVAPGSFSNSPFLGGRATMSPISPSSGAFAWATTGTAVPNMIRHDFALNTCNGCHQPETGTPFVHVGCRPNGGTAPLSGFLIGDGVGGPFVHVIPGAPAVPVKFFDLQRREQDLVNFLMTPCALLALSTATALPGTVSH